MVNSVWTIEVGRWKYEVRSDKNAHVIASELRYSGVKRGNLFYGLQGRFIDNRSWRMDIENEEQAKGKVSNELVAIIIKFVVHFVFPLRPLRLYLNQFPIQSLIIKQTAKRQGPITPMIYAKPTLPTLFCNRTECLHEAFLSSG